MRAGGQRPTKNVGVWGAGAPHQRPTPRPNVRAAQTAVDPLGSLGPEPPNGIQYAIDPVGATGSMP